ncbi:MAG: LPS translocon maturation chaperone LptM [Arsenophonus sp. NC-PE1-MAG3]
MKKLIWLFMTSILLILICACGLKGPLYFLVKTTVEQKGRSTISSKEIEHQLIQTEILQKSSNKNSQLLTME